MKTLLAAAAIALAFAVPASAAEMAKCDDASMMKMDEAMKADGAMKEDVEMAMKEVDMAKMAMKDGKMDDCSMHLDAAMKQMKMN
jgi:hypothetical protein